MHLGLRDFEVQTGHGAGSPAWGHGLHGIGGHSWDRWLRKCFGIALLGSASFYTTDNVV